MLAVLAAAVAGAAEEIEDADLCRFGMYQTTAALMIAVTAIAPQPNPDARSNDCDTVRRRFFSRA